MLPRAKNVIGYNHNRTYETLDGDDNKKGGMTSLVEQQFSLITKKIMYTKFNFIWSAPLATALRTFWR